jgi:hypothetical protein
MNCNVSIVKGSATKEIKDSSKTQLAKLLFFSFLFFQTVGVKISHLLSS